MFKKITIISLALISFFISDHSFASKMINLDSGLKYQINTEGNGKIADSGNMVGVHYTGWLNNNGAKGKKFDSSKDRNQVFYFTLGQRRVIRGWEEGVKGMKIGETRTLYIPSHLGYGVRGAGQIIPPNADLIFEVELKEIR